MAPTTAHADDSGPSGRDVMRNGAAWSASHSLKSWARRLHCTVTVQVL